MVNKGFNFSQDGPGNRLVYHLWGCNMRCPWCANPEAMGADVRKTLPEEANLPFAQVTVTEILRQSVSAKKIMVEGGGVTFTGGEPTLQWDALARALAALQKEGIHTAIETNGTSGHMDVILPHLNLLIMDVKHYNDTAHRNATGLPLTPVLATLHRAAEWGGPVWVRTPLVNGVNAAKDDIAGFLQLYQQLDTHNMSFELLEYHEYGRDKWKKCGLEYTVVDGRVPPGRVNDFENAYRAAGLSVIRT